MPTLKQALVIQKLVENNGKSVSRAMREAGYSPATAKNPSSVTNSKGFKASLAKYGLTEKLITLSLVEDIKAKPKQRISELTLGADILGMRKQEGNKTQNNIIILPTEILNKNGINFSSETNSG